MSATQRTRPTEAERDRSALETYRGCTRYDCIGIVAEVHFSGDRKRANAAIDRALRRERDWKGRAA